MRSERALGGFRSLGLILAVRAAKCRMPDMVPLAKPVAEVCAVAKKDLQPGDSVSFKGPFPKIPYADLSGKRVGMIAGGSGITAVTDILRMSSVPVIFVTAYPERLLTGERPEPTYLVTKPFEPDTLKVTISQALSFSNSGQAKRVAV